MKVRFFTVLLAACLVFAFWGHALADECGSCSVRSDSLIGAGGIEYLVQQQQAHVSPFNAELRVGGLYDSRVGSTSGSEADADNALVARLTAGWQAPLKGVFGFRMDYRGFADFYADFRDYNVIDQTLSVEPQYRTNRFIFSIPLSFNLTLEDGRHDYNRYAVVPTLTYLIPDTKQALAIYAIAAQIDDRDRNDWLDEDGKTFGGGCSYLYYFAGGSRVRLSLDYQHTIYDSYVWQYASTSTSDFSDRRGSDVLVAGLDILFQITNHIGLYADYAFVHSNSNVGLFEYDRHIVEGGLALKL